MKNKIAIVVHAGAGPDRNIAIEFNSERMMRAWKEGSTPMVSKIY